MSAADNLDWKNPNYAPIFRERIAALQRIRREPPRTIALLKAYYRDHPADFINDWGTTYDPRNVEVGLPPVVPFVLFQKQRDWVEWVCRKWRAREPGISEKSREVGLSWLSIALACTLCLHHRGMSIGFGSYLKEYVDQTGEMKSIFAKGRMFMANLPTEFSGGWDDLGDAPYMRLNFRSMGSIIGGQVGDEIGRGDRRAIYFVDESAHLEHPALVDAALSMTTNCRMDMSSVNGRANSFAERRHAGNIEVFTFHWRDDPRKDEAWYAKKCAELPPVVVAQEIDIDYSASIEGVLIPSAWVQAAIDAHTKLAFVPSGVKTGALDVADEGKDLNAFCGAHGVVVEAIEEWSGKGDDIFGTVQRAFALCDEHGYKSFRYDADGLGAGVRGDARVINEGRKLPTYRPLTVEAFRGSGAVSDPEREDVKGRKNEDFFANAKAQSWWALRTRFQKTYRAVIGEEKTSPDEMISLPSSLPLVNKLAMELSQPTYSINTAGKIVIDKAPDGTRSPNLADAVMIRFSAVKRSLVVSDNMMNWARKKG